MSPVGERHDWTVMNRSAPGGVTHVCHCIGCCPKCGQCRTTPWHAKVCDRIAELRRQEYEIMRDVELSGS